MIGRAMFPELLPVRRNKHIPLTLLQEIFYLGTIARFPEDFMFQLTNKEYENLIPQSATSKWEGRRKPPYACSEQGRFCRKSNRISIQTDSPC
jgi:hypothetical protein